MKSLEKFEAVLSKKYVLTSPEEISNYNTDWSRLPGVGRAVLLPSTTAEVSAILKICQAEKIPVVPSGGRTGLVGGATAISDEVLLSLTRMNKMGKLDPVVRTLEVEAGVTTEAVHEATAKEGLTWPIDLAAKGSSHIGGNLATNAGGVRVIRYGMTRKWVMGVTAVTMDGSILKIQNGLEKNNCGYDLMQLLIGSEGTLAIITQAILKLAQLPKHSNVFLFAVKDLEGIRAILAHARTGPFFIQAFEFFSDRCLQTVQSKLNRKSKLKEKAPFYVLMEIEPHVHSNVDKWLEDLLENSSISDAMMGQSSEEIRSIWTLREGITESIALTGPVKKFDVSVPVTSIIDFLEKAQALASKFKFWLYLFGHFGDGSPHLNLVKPPEMDISVFEKECKTFEAGLFELILKFGGAVSSEHGMGVLRKNWLTVSRSPKEIELFRSIKKSFDPDGLLNPGKLIV